MQVDEAIDGMPELLPAGYMDSDDKSDSDKSEDSKNDEDSEGMEDGVQQFGSHLRLAQYVRQTVERMYENCYEQPHDIPSCILYHKCHTF